MIKYLLIFGFVACATAGIDDKCLKCICDVESNCNPNVGCHPDPDTLSCGPYQIKEAYWNDCGKPGANYQDCANNKECAEGCVKAYLDRYAEKCHANPNCETYARVHNGGPNGCNVPDTVQYWEKVKKCLG